MGKTGSESDREACVELQALFDTVGHWLSRQDGGRPRRWYRWSNVKKLFTGYSRHVRTLQKAHAGILDDVPKRLTPEPDSNGRIGREYLEILSTDLDQCLSILRGIYTNLDEAKAEAQFKQRQGTLTIIVPIVTGVITAITTVIVELIRNGAKAGATQHVSAFPGRQEVPAHSSSVIIPALLLTAAAVIVAYVVMRVIGRWALARRKSACSGQP